MIGSYNAYQGDPHAEVLNLTKYKIPLEFVAFPFFGERHQRGGNHTLDEGKEET
jgi:hypothetical protein